MVNINFVDRDKDKLRKKSGIYQIKNLINGKLYIGKTVNEFEERYWVHNSTLRNNKHFNKHLQKSWNKYKEENFEFSVIEVCSDNVEDREKYWISKKNTLKNGYNQTIGGDGISGNKLSEEQKRAIGERNRQYNLGRKHTEETKKKMSMIKKGKKIPIESIRKREATKSLNPKVFTKKEKEHLSNIFSGSKSNFATVDEDYVVRVKEMIVKGCVFDEIFKKYPKISKEIYATLKLDTRWRHVKCNGWDEYVIKIQKEKENKEEKKKEDIRVAIEMMENGYNNSQIRKRIKRSEDFLKNNLPKVKDNLVPSSCK